MAEESPAERRQPWKSEGRQPERAEGPTPNGGAYSIAYYHDDGQIEIVEFDSSDRAIWRTHGFWRRAVEDLPSRDEDPTEDDRSEGES